MGLLGVHNRVHFCHKYSSSRITYLSCISNTLIPSHNNSHSNLKYYNCSSRPMLALYSFLSNIFHFSLLLSRGILREVCVFAESRVHRHLILQTLQHLYPVRECHGMRLVWQKMHSAKRLRLFSVSSQQFTNILHQLSFNIVISMPLYFTYFLLSKSCNFTFYLNI